MSPCYFINRYWDYFSDQFYHFSDHFVGMFSVSNITWPVPLDYKEMGNTLHRYHQKMMPEIPKLPADGHQIIGRSITTLISYEWTRIDYSQFTKLTRPLCCVLAAPAPEQEVCWWPDRGHRARPHREDRAAGQQTEADAASQQATERLVGVHATGEGIMVVYMWVHYDCLLAVIQQVTESLTGQMGPLWVFTNTAAQQVIERLVGFHAGALCLFTCGYFIIAYLLLLSQSQNGSWASCCIWGHYDY